MVAGLGFRDLEFGFRVSGVGCTAKSIRERAAGANEIIAAPTVAAWKAVCAAFGFDRSEPRIHDVNLRKV